MSEDQIQGAFFQWAWNTFPQLRRLFFHIPNGGFRSKTEAARLASIGVVSGVADILLIKEGEILWLEFKKPGGKQSIEQKRFQIVQEALGWDYFVVDDVEVAKRKFLDFYGVSE